MKRIEIMGAIVYIESFHMYFNFVTRVQGLERNSGLTRVWSRRLLEDVLTYLCILK
jgi:hypothetical protein